MAQAELNLDADPRNADWIKTQHWEFSTDVQTFLWQIGGVENLQHFFTLPAAEAMPDSLRLDLAMKTDLHVKIPAKLKYSPDQPRDERGRFGSGGGTATATPTPMTDKEFFGIWRSNHIPGTGYGPETDAIRGPHAADSAAVLEYTGQGYYRINGGLRADAWADPSSVEEIKKLDDWTHSDTLDRPTLLYRTGSNQTDQQVPTTIGTQFTDKGFVSTSATAAFEPSEISHEQGIVIEAPQGTPFGTGTFGEREVILPRDSTFEVTGSSGNVVHVKLVKAG